MTYAKLMSEACKIRTVKHVCLHDRFNTNGSKQITTRLLNALKKELDDALPLLLYRDSVTVDINDYTIQIQLKYSDDIIFTKILHEIAKCYMKYSSNSEYINALWKTDVSSLQGYAAFFVPSKADAMTGDIHVYIPSSINDSRLL